MCTSATPSGAGGIYEYDEVPFYGFPLGWEEYNYIKANCIQEPVSGVDIFGTKFRLLRDLMDVVGVDPYGYLVDASPEEYVAGISATATCSLYRANNQADTLSNQCYPSRIDLWTNELGRDTYGARPTWDVFKMYGSGTYFGYTYEPIHRQLWGAILGCRVYGNLGCSALGWGWVSASGMENTWNKGDTQAWYDSQKAFGQVKALQSILEQPVADSTQMNAGSGTVSSGATVVGGKIISAITTSVSTATACNVQAGTNSIYNNTTLFPFGPVESATTTDAVTGDQYIIVANLCDSSFNVTFNLPAIPVGQTNVEVLYEGRTIPISGGAFTDTWQPMDTHVYVVRAPRGAVIGAASNLTGTPHSLAFPVSGQEGMQGANGFSAGAGERGSKEPARPQPSVSDFMITPVPRVKVSMMTLKLGAIGLKPTPPLQRKSSISTGGNNETIRSNSGSILHHPQR